MVRQRDANERQSTAVSARRVRTFRNGRTISTRIPNSFGTFSMTENYVRSATFYTPRIVIPSFRVIRHCELGTRVNFFRCICITNHFCILQIHVHFYFIELGFRSCTTRVPSSLPEPRRITKSNEILAETRYCSTPSFG